jgi:hypothetical protein
VSGVRRCFMQLRDIAMSGYDVWGRGCWGGGVNVCFHIRRHGCIVRSDDGSRVFLGCRVRYGVRMW